MSADVLAYCCIFENGIIVVEQTLLSLSVQLIPRVMMVIMVMLVVVMMISLV